MHLATHGDEKYENSEKLAEAGHWPTLSIEHRQFGAGQQATPVAICTEIVMLLSGGGIVSRGGNGQDQRSLARPGTSYLVPIGTKESHLELSDRMECIHVYLPPNLMEQSALADYDVEPNRVEIAYAHGLIDPVLFHLCTPLRDLLHRPRQQTDQLFVEGIQVALAAHLVGHYSVDTWRQPDLAPTLEKRRLERVLEFIDAGISKDIRLLDLATEACLSPFHFSRLFRKATGLSPSRYVSERRVQAAQVALASGNLSLFEIAMQFGFASQENFTRVFRRATGLTPGQYREMCFSHVVKPDSV